MEANEEPCLECVAVMININYGHNRELMENCRELYEYSYLVEEVRKGRKSGLSLADSVDRAVNTCIENDILKEFLSRHRAEVKNMILEEFDMEKHLKLVRMEGYQEGEEKGKAKITELMKKLLEEQRYDDLNRAANDPEYCELLFREYKIE